MSLTRQVPPAEMRLEAAHKLLESNDDLTWLKVQRDLEVADREEAFQAGDFLVANKKDERANYYARLIVVIEDLRKKEEVFQKALVNKIVIALEEAERPAWKATHRHYKGTLYRVTGLRQDANGQELIEGVDYDDAMGNKYFLHRERWEGKLDSGKMRYQALIFDDA